MPFNWTQACLTCCDISKTFPPSADLVCPTAMLLLSFHGRSSLLGFPLRNIRSAWCMFSVISHIRYSLGKQDKVAYFIKYLLEVTLLSLGLSWHPYEGGWGGQAAAGTPHVLGSACAVSATSQGSARVSPSGPYKEKLILTKKKLKSLDSAGELTTQFSHSLG